MLLLSLILSFFFIAIPSGILIGSWLTMRKKIYRNILIFFWGGIVTIVSLSLLSEKMQPAQDDIYGSYIIDRTKFPGKQADWQYDHFRFEITKNGKFDFHQTEQQIVLKTWSGDIRFLPAYNIPRLVLKVDTPHHHIIENEPTLYRTSWSFYYVFHSSKFGNVFFKKGKWKPVKQ